MKEAAELQAAGSEMAVAKTDQEREQSRDREIESGCSLRAEMGNRSTQK